MRYSSADLSRDFGTRIWSALIAPRPVFLIASRSFDGRNNIAPYSSIALISVDPPIISISFGRRHGRQKNTLQNILATKEFSLNVVPHSLALIANASAEGLDKVEDFERLSLNPSKFEVSGAVAISESPASVACRLTQKIEVDGSDTTLILAQCSEILFNDEFARDSIFDPIEANVIASVGLEDYITAKGDAFTLPRHRE